MTLDHYKHSYIAVCWNNCKLDKWLDHATFFKKNGLKLNGLKFFFFFFYILKIKYCTFKSRMSVCLTLMTAPQCFPLQSHQGFLLFQSPEHIKLYEFHDWSWCQCFFSGIVRVLTMRYLCFRAVSVGWLLAALFRLTGNFKRPRPWRHCRSTDNFTLQRENGRYGKKFFSWSYGKQV